MSRATRSCCCADATPGGMVDCHTEQVGGSRPFAGKTRQLACIARLVVLDFVRSRGLLFAAILVGFLALLGVAGRLLGGEGDEGARFVLSFNLQTSYLAALILSWAAAVRQLAPEVENRTMMLLLARPVRRGEVILTKTLTVAVLGVSATLLFSIFVLVFSPGLPELSAGLAIQFLVFRALAVTLLVVIAVALSLFVPPMVGAIAIALFFLGGGLLIEQASAILPTFTNPLITAFVPDFGLFDVTERFVGGMAPMSAGTVLAALAYAFILSVVWMGVAMIRFQRKAL